MSDRHGALLGDEFPIYKGVLEEDDGDFLLGLLTEGMEKSIRMGRRSLSAAAKERDRFLGEQEIKKKDWKLGYFFNGITIALPIINTEQQNKEVTYEDTNVGK